MKFFMHIKTYIYIKKLIEIIEKKDPIYSALSLYFIVENKLVNDKKEINNLFDLVIDSQVENELKNLIIYKKTSPRKSEAG